MSDPHDLLRLSALKSIQNEEYGKAVMSFLSLLTTRYPIAKIENDLVYAMDLYVTSLCNLNQHSKGLWLWAKAVEIANDKSIILLYSHARFLCTIGELSQALENLQKCTTLDPSYAPAIETAENVKGLIVDRWHFRMLNDKERNLTYKHSIEKAVASKGPDCTVLDIGGGTGLLSIYAILAGCKHVYCCELNDDLASVARKCIAEYGPTFSNKITVLSSHSKDLKIGMNQDIPAKVSIIVTELVDSGLLGEHIIETLRDASLRLLSEGGVVIPHSATVYGHPIESTMIACRQRVIKVPMNKILGINHKDVDDFSNTNIRSACSAIAELNNILSRSFEVDEKYTCESLSSTFPFKALSNPCCMKTIIFAENETPKDLMATDKGLVPPSSSIVDLNLIMTESGSIDGFAYWFDLHLEANADTDYSISTAPGRNKCGWDQAILFGNKITNNSNTSPLMVCEGQQVTFQCAHTDDHINLTLVTDALPLPTDRLSDSIYHLGEMDIAMLNDLDKSAGYLYGLHAAITDVKKKRRLSTLLVTEQQSISVLDLCGNWQSTVISVLNTISLGDHKARDISVNKVLQTFEMIDECRISCPSKESGDAFSDIMNGIDKRIRLAVNTGSIVESYLCVQRNELEELGCDMILNESDDESDDELSSEDYSDSNTMKTHSIEERFITESSLRENSTIKFSTDEHPVIQSSATDHSITQNATVKNLSIVEDCSEHSTTEDIISNDDSDFNKNSTVNVDDYHVTMNHISDQHIDTSEPVPPEPVVSACWGPYSVIVCDLIEGSGLIRQSCLQELRFALQFLSTKEVITVPYSVAVMCAIVECDSLQSHHRVDSSNMQEENISKHINSLGANQLRELDLSHMEGVRFLSKPVEVLSFTLSSLSIGETASVCAPVEMELIASEAGTAHAVCYWFRLTMCLSDSSSVIDTGPFANDRSNSSNSNGNNGSDSPMIRARKHWRQAATLLKIPTLVAEGDAIVVDIGINLSFGVCLCASE